MTNLDHSNKVLEILSNSIYIVGKKSDEKKDQKCIPSEKCDQDIKIINPGNKNPSNQIQLNRESDEKFQESFDPSATIDININTKSKNQNFIANILDNTTKETATTTKKNDLIDQKELDDSKIYKDNKFQESMKYITDLLLQNGFKSIIKNRKSEYKLFEYHI